MPAHHGECCPRVDDRCLRKLHALIATEPLRGGRRRTLFPRAKLTMVGVALWRARPNAFIAAKSQPPCPSCRAAPNGASPIPHAHHRPRVGRGVGVARLASSVEVLLRVLIEATQDFEAKPQAGLHPWVPRRRCRLGAFPAHPSELTHEVLAQHPIEGIVSGWQ